MTPTDETIENKIMYAKKLIRESMYNEAKKYVSDASTLAGMLETRAYHEEIDGLWDSFSEHEQRGRKPDNSTYEV